MSDWLTFVLLGLAAYRLQRFITLDTIPGAWIRGRFAEGSKPHEFVSCPHCAGSWITLAVFAVAAQFASIVWPAVQALAAAALVGLASEWETR